METPSEVDCALIVRFRNAVDIEDCRRGLTKKKFEFEKSTRNCLRVVSEKACVGRLVWT